jgi:hypothetical protein
LFPAIALKLQTCSLAFCSAAGKGEETIKAADSL